MTPDEAYDRAHSADDATALALFTQAAEQGHSQAQYCLGLIYLQGRRGTSPNATEAVRWLKRGADQGDADCQYVLAHAYENGLGVPQDNVQAFLWLILASRGGNDRAREHRQWLRERITAKQAGAAGELAREWRPAPEA